jgi:hypothetical protein
MLIKYIGEVMVNSRVIAKLNNSKPAVALNKKIRVKSFLSNFLYFFATNTVRNA